jgi:GT2 family glycosyltransferase
MTSPDRTLPTVAVIIPTRNRHALLRACVEKVLAGDVLPTEVVIVDQSDRPLDPAELHSRDVLLRYIWSSERGPSRGRNAGVRATRCDVIAFVDDDVLVEPVWLAELTQSLIDGGRSRVVTGSVLAGEPEQPDAFAPSLKAETDRVVFRGRPANDHLSTGNRAIWRSAFQEVGMFDKRLGPGSRYPSSEDNDLCYRLLEAGYEIEYVPHIRGVHRAWRGADALVPLAWGYGKGQGAYWAKHLTFEDSYMLRRAVQDLTRHAWRAIVTARSETRAAIADCAYVAGLVAGASAWLLSERRVRRDSAAARRSPRS